VAVCLGITFNIKIGVLQIPSHKLQEVLSLCTFYLSKSKITKTNLLALIGSLMFLHKAIKPARLFVNRILALLWDMSALIKWPSMRALTRTSDGLLPALMRLMAPLLFLSACGHGLIFLWLLHFKV
jgi:hypothetical protein